MAVVVVVVVVIIIVVINSIQFNSIQYTFISQRVSLEGGLVTIKIAIPSSKLTPLLPDSNNSRKVRQSGYKVEKKIQTICEGTNRNEQGFAPHRHATAQTTR